MNKLNRLLGLAIVAALSMQPQHLRAEPLPAPVPINAHLGEWSSTATPYAAGNVVIHASKTWLSLGNGNSAEPGAPGTDASWRMLGDVTDFRYKIGDRGPGGGWIIFVDSDNEYPAFTYLEAAPRDAANRVSWCDAMNISIPGASDLGLGQGQSNTQAMLAVCTRGAANAARAYRGPKGKSDWYLPSLSELRLMNKWFAEQGRGGFRYEKYWSSSEFSSTDAWQEHFDYDSHDYEEKGVSLRVRPIRAF